MVEEIFYLMLTEKCVGKKHAKSNFKLKTIALMMTEENMELYQKIIMLNEGDVRKIIHKLREDEERKFICASGKGYYIAKTEKEARDYQERLYKRLTTMWDIYNSQRKKILTNYNVNIDDEVYKAVGDNGDI